MPFVNLDLDEVEPTWVGMHLDGSKEQAAELVDGITNAGQNGLLYWGRPEGYKNGESWLWRVRLQPILGDELEGNPGDWVIVKIVGPEMREILIMSDEDRITRGFSVVTP